MAQTELEDDRIAQKLAKSLESTSGGLAAFSTSMQPIKDALKPYRQMQLVLMQQRLWAERHPREDLNPLWQKIAASSRELHEVFSGFAEVMDALRSIDSLTQPAGPIEKKAPAGEPRAESRRDPDEALARWAEQALTGFNLSPARLAVMRPKRKTAAQVKTLAQAGILEARGRGSYRLTERARRALALKLAELASGESASD
jgi:hypothetical protein